MKEFRELEIAFKHAILERFETEIGGRAAVAAAAAQGKAKEVLAELLRIVNKDSLLIDYRD